VIQVTERPIMTKPKLIIILVAALLVLIVVLQNNEPVRTKLLFFSITMQRSLLLFVTALVGFILGAGVCLAARTRPKKGAAAENDRH
jgi:uncharacterized integral membrane protein